MQPTEEKLLKTTGKITSKARSSAQKRRLAYYSKKESE